MTCLFVSRYVVFGALVILAVTLSACAGNPSENYERGTKAVWAADYDLARSALEDYLSGSTERFESSRARYELARLKYLGLGGPKDQRAAVQLLEQEISEEALMTRRYARHLLAEMYLRGQGVEVNVPRALSLLQEAGYSRALADLAMIHWAGDLVPEDRAKAVLVAEKIMDFGGAARLFRHGALDDFCAQDAGGAAPDWACLHETDKAIVRSADEIWQSNQPEDGAARMEYLSKLYAALVSRSFDDRAGWYRYAAEKGSAPAQFRLALIYGAPDSPWHDPSKAAGWLEQSARQGYARAQLAKGVNLASGQAVSDDNYREALHWLTRAADQEQAEANLWLAHLYLNPVAGQPQQINRAIEYLEQIAAEDDRAKHLLADIYLSDRLEANDEQRRRRAMALLESMAYRDAEAAYKLGVIYARGVEGIPRNLADAVSWLRRAADKDHLPAQLTLARVLDRDGRDESAARVRSRFVFMPVDAVPAELKNHVSQARYRQALYYSRQPDAAMESHRIVQLLELSSREQNLSALAMLGLLYDRGEIVARDEALAYQYLDRWDSLYQARKDQARSGDSVWSGLLYDERFGNKEAEEALLRLRIRRLNGE